MSDWKSGQSQSRSPESERLKIGSYKMTHGINFEHRNVVKSMMAW